MHLGAVGVQMKNAIESHTFNHYQDQTRLITDGFHTFDILALHCNNEITINHMRMGKADCIFSLLLHCPNGLSRGCPGCHVGYQIACFGASLQ